MELDIPASIGLNAPFQNAGIVRNVGWELGIGYHDRKGDWSWGVDANLSDVVNQIIDMKGTASGDLLRNEEGYAIKSIYGLKCIGMARSQEEADQVNATCPQYGMETKPGMVTASSTVSTRSTPAIRTVRNMFSVPTGNSAGRAST